MQKEIIRITIKGASGYGSVDKAYEDRLLIAKVIHNQILKKLFFKKTDMTCPIINT